jgi:hypothetical protein
MGARSDWQRGLPRPVAFMGVFVDKEAAEQFVDEQVGSDGAFVGSIHDEPERCHHCGRLLWEAALVTTAAKTDVPQLAWALATVARHDGGRLAGVVVCFDEAPDTGLVDVEHISVDRLLGEHRPIRRHGGRRHHAGCRRR